MVSIPSYLASLMQTGSAHDIGDKEDPRMIRQGIQVYPEDVNVQEVVRDIEDFRETAKMMEPRLSVLLVGLVNSLDIGLMAKSSEGGKMINSLQRERNVLMPKVKPEGDSTELEEWNSVQQKDQDLGNRKY